MKTKLSILVLATLVGISLASGQETKGKIGIGVSLNPIAILGSGSTSIFLLPVGLSNIYIPIMAGPSFRIEPEAGIFTISTETTLGSSSEKSSTTLLRLGIGLFYVHSSESSFNSYFGPRIGILSTSETSSTTGNSETKTSETDFFIGFCIGSEYLFSPHFSIGAEAQLNYISFGNPEYTPSQSSERTMNCFTNNALIFFRWYF